MAPAEGSIVDVFLEAGAKRVFAGAIEWPGWTRGGKDEQAALQTLVDYAPRYAASLGTAARGVPRPKDPSGLRVIERLAGNAGTDFGVPSMAPAVDGRDMDAPTMRRQVAILKASWAAFDRAAKAAVGVTLRKGPRGGGREQDAIVRHVVEAEAGYLHRLGGKHAGDLDDPATSLPEVRREILDMLRFRAGGGTPPLGKRTAPLWTPRSFLRRTIWHALDHAWELEDRSR